MKKLLILALFSSVLAGKANATPYFSTLADLNTIQLEGGLGIDPRGSKPNQTLTVASTIWHNPANPSLTDPSWSLLTLGGAGSTWGDLKVVFGPSINIAPNVENGLLAALDFFAPNSFGNLKSALYSTSSSPQDAGACVSLLAEVAPASKWSLSPLLFVGGWLKVGSK